MEIKEIRAGKIPAGPGVWALLAEARVTAGGEDRYAAVHCYDETVYSVSAESVYDFLAGDGDAPEDGNLEEYARYRDAKASAYAEVFSRLRKVVRML